MKTDKQWELGKEVFEAMTKALPGFAFVTEKRRNRKGKKMLETA